MLRGGVSELDPDSASRNYRARHSAGGIPSSDGAVDDGMRSISETRSSRSALPLRRDHRHSDRGRQDATPGAELFQDLTAISSDFPIICPGASGTLSERDSKFESASLQQTVRVSPRPGRYRSKNPRFRAGVRRWGPQRLAGVSRDRAKRRCYLYRAIFQYRSAGNVIGQRRPRLAKAAARVNSQAKQGALLLPGQRQT